LHKIIPFLHTTYITAIRTFAHILVFMLTGTSPRTSPP